MERKAMRLKPLYLVAFTSFSILALSGCETIHDQWSAVREGVSDLGSGIFGDDSEQPAQEAASKAETVAQNSSLSKAETIDAAPDMKAEDRAIETETLESPPSESAEMHAEESMDAEKITAAPQTACPSASIVHELDRYAQFKDPANPGAGDIVSGVKITNVESRCTYKEKTVAVDLDISFTGTPGPGAHDWNLDKGSFSYPYFVAITTSDGTIVAKEVFAATLSYKDDDSAQTQQEHLRQVISLDDRKGTDYQLMVGFQLTPEELAYNRDHDESVADTAPVKTAPAKAATDITDHMNNNAPAAGQ